MKAYFHQRVWVCVSDPFDPMRISRLFLKPSRKSLLVSMSWKLYNKKFAHLLPIRSSYLCYDVWTENYELWEQVESSLKGGAPGSRILVTTRNENVSTIMGTTYKQPLGELSNEQCRSLFSTIAFHGRSGEKVEAS